MSSTGKIIQSESDNSKELVKAINFLASEVADSGIALNSNVSNVNGTVGETNKSIKELRDSINKATENIIFSSEKLSLAQENHAKRMLNLNWVLVIVGISQVLVMAGQMFIMQKQSHIMKNQIELTKNLAEFEFKPNLEIEFNRVQYINKKLTFFYYLSNSGKSNVLDIKRCHTVDFIDKTQNLESRVKNETCISNSFDKVLISERLSVVHEDDIGTYELKHNSPDKFYRINLEVFYKTEDFLGKKCAVSRSFDLIPHNDEILTRSSSHFNEKCE